MNDDAINDAIEQALLDEPEINPSLGFSSRLMRSVRHEAAYRRAIPFPWLPVGAGLGLFVALILVAALGGAPEPTVTAIPDHLATALASLGATLTGVLALTWWALRLARR